MIVPRRIPLFCLLFATMVFGLRLHADIPGNYTLTSNQTFTSTITASPFTIGSSDIFNLQSYTATFTGTGNFEINSSIIGTGGVLIDLAPTAQIEYNKANSYTGPTIVRSGSLLLDTPSEQNNGIMGDLLIGGGPNQASVWRDDKHNRELIADTSTITISANGTLEFDRMAHGNSHVHDSLETVGRVVMNGGTILNGSDNDRLTSLHIGTVTLTANSIWDLGKAMTITIGDVNTNTWTPGAILTIKNWSPQEPIYAGHITPQQLGQIRFELPTGIAGAQQLPDTQIVPLIIVPEASTIVLVPMLIGAALWPELRRRVRKEKV